MMRGLRLLSTCAAFAFAASVADAFSSRNGARVNPVNDAVFEVIPRQAIAGPDIWCSAADYAQRALGAAWTDQLFIARGRGASVTTNRRTAVHFTLDPDAAGVTPAPPSVNLNALRIGEHMSVQMAHGYCNRSPRLY